MRGRTKHLVARDAGRAGVLELLVDLRPALCHELGADGERDVAPGRLLALVLAGGHDLSDPGPIDRRRLWKGRVHPEGRPGRRGGEVGGIALEEDFADGQGEVEEGLVDGRLFDDGARHLAKDLEQLERLAAVGVERDLCAPRRRSSVGCHGRAAAHLVCLRPRVLVVLWLRLVLALGIGRDVDADELWALLLGLVKVEVPRDAERAGRVVDGDDCAPPFNGRLD